MYTLASRYLNDLQNGADHVGRPRVLRVPKESGQVSIQHFTPGQQSRFVAIGYCWSRPRTARHLIKTCGLELPVSRSGRSGEPAEKRRYSKSRVGLKS